MKKKLSLGSMIRDLRTERGMKVCELAKKVDVNPVYITQIEKHGKLPSLNVIRRISSVFRNHGLLERYIIEKHPELKDVILDIFVARKLNKE